MSAMHHSDLDLSRSLIANYQKTGSVSTKEEILSLLSFQKIQLEQRTKKLSKVLSRWMCYNLVLFVYNASIIGLFIFDLHQLNSQDASCQDLRIVYIKLMALHGSNIVNLLFVCIITRSKTVGMSALLTLLLLADIVLGGLVYYSYIQNNQMNDDCVEEINDINITLNEPLAWIVGSIFELMCIIAFIGSFRVMNVLRSIQFRSKIILLIENKVGTES